MEKRHVCIVCKAKRNQSKMMRFRQHWACSDCLSTLPGNEEAPETKSTGGVFKILNLYAGIGGNRNLWPSALGVSVTAVEYNPKVAAAYKELYPNDTVVCGDAHKYLLKNFANFDFIWSSPPCQSHSRMNYWTPTEKKVYPDLSLYQEIIFLKNFCKIPFVVENVNGYYTPLIPATITMGRHLFWSNFLVKNVYVRQIDDFINLRDLSAKKAITDWLGFSYEKNIYISSKDPLQLYRNCVHPKIGLSVFNDMLASLGASGNLNPLGVFQLGINQTSLNI